MSIIKTRKNVGKGISETVANGGDRTMQLLMSRQLMVEKMVKRQAEKLGLSQYASEYGQRKALESLKAGASAFRAIQVGIAGAESKRLMLVIDNVHNAA